ncbi:MAG: type II toxin-antitoxin system ParD family antitoxin [Betaproteobacteria bacterium]|nr:MAG: type II toxin-antitoxin system ParD family antitoxin [Betaproteobacteria bacterium]
MPTRNVVPTDHQTRLVEKLVATGRCRNASEVPREGLCLIEDREARDRVRLHALREAARAGMADIDAGRFRSFESPTALSRHLTAIADKAIGRKPATRPK